MEYVCGGDLFYLLRRTTRFPDRVAKFYATEVTIALNYLHLCGIVYRDLKPENVLIDIDGHIKLTGSFGRFDYLAVNRRATDFGFAKHIGNKGTYTLCGTPECKPATFFVAATRGMIAMMLCMQMLRQRR